MVAFRHAYRSQVLHQRTCCPSSARKLVSFTFRYLVHLKYLVIAEV